MTTIGTAAYNNLVVQPGKTGTLRLLSGASDDIGNIMRKSLTCTAAAGAANIGNGTIGAVTQWAAARIGAYSLTCTAKAASGSGTAASAYLAGYNHGNGTITAAPTVTSPCKIGTWHLFFVETVSNSGIFKLEDPDGVTVGTVVVGTAYQGNGLSFTIADGTTDFSAGDEFQINVSGGNAGTFQVIAPNGDRLVDLTVGEAYAGNAFSVTVADGTTDFAVGDTITITVADSGKVVEANSYENLLAGVLLETVDASAADAYAAAMIGSGILVRTSIDPPAGLTAAGFAVALSDQLSITMVEKIAASIT
jgi:hypothetical protein